MIENVECMPTPIANAWSAFERETRPFYKLNRLVDTYETLIKYTAILAVQNFYAANMAHDFPETDQMIREQIALPSLGHWEMFLRDVLRSFSEHSADLISPDLISFYFKPSRKKKKSPQKYFTDLGASGQIIELRNAYLGHGATLGDEKSEQLLAEHTPHLNTLLQKAEFLKALPLYFVHAQIETGVCSLKPLMGVEYRSAASVVLEIEHLPLQHVIVRNPDTGHVLDLHPLLVYLHCTERLALWDECHAKIVGTTECQQPNAFFFNSLKRGQIDFLEYANGHHSRYKKPNPLQEEFTTRFSKSSKPKKQAVSTCKSERFEQLSATLTEYFVGREQELQALQRFAATSGKRVIVVVGVPGQGKSALLARWSSQHVASRHFIREGDESTIEVSRIFENLALQLSEQNHLSYTPPKMPDSHEYRQVFLAMLKAAAEKSADPVVVIIDGVDEAQRTMTRRDAHTLSIVHWLPEPGMLPENMRLILSIRPELMNQSDFSAKFGQDKANYLTLGKLDERDVRDLLYQVRSKYDVLDHPGYIETIVTRSEGSPLYLRMLLEDLSEGRIAFGEIDMLPKGVQAYFERVLHYIEGEGRTQEMPDITTLLQAKQDTLVSLVEQGLLTQKQADEMLDAERHALQGKAGVKSLELLVLFCLAKAPISLKESAAILKADLSAVQRAFDIIHTVLIQSGQEEEGCFTLFHAGFREYVLHVGDYTDSQFHRYEEIINDISERLLAYCADWKSHRSPYSLAYLPQHLLEAGQHDDLFTLARNVAFRQTQTQTSPNKPDLPLFTLQAALQASAESNDAVKMAEFLMAHAQQVIEITQQENPLEALRNGSLERAIKLADLYKIEQCIQWYLLLVWELHDTMRSDEAWATLIRLRHKNLPRLRDEDNANAAELLAHIHVIDEFSFWDLCQRIIGDYIELCEVLIRQRNFAAALRAAKQIAGYRADGTGRTWVLQKIAGAQVQAGDLTAAITTAQQTDEEEELAWVLQKIAATQAQIGDLTGAVTTTHQITNDRVRAEALRDIAVAYAQAGDMSGAVMIAQQISDEWERARVLAFIAKAQAQSDDLTAVTTIVHQLTPERQQAAALRDIAKRTQVNDITIVRTTFATEVTTAQKITVDRERMWALGEIAAMLAQAGDMTNAVTIMQQFTEQHERIWVLIKIATAQQVQADNMIEARETFAAAVTAAQKITEEEAQSWALLIIARAQARTGDMAGAVTTAQQIMDPETQDMALQAIAAMQAQSGDLIAAFTTTQQISDERWQREEALLSIAREQAQAGDVAGAVTIVQQITDPGAQDMALQSIAVIQAQSGDLTAAFTTTQKISCEGGWHVGALLAIAEAQSQAGNMIDARITFATAFMTVEQIIDEEDQIWALIKIASAQAQVGDVTDAFTTIQQIGDERLRSEALRVIAETQIKIGFAEDALKTADLILIDRNNHLPGIAAAFAERCDKVHFKRMLIPCASFLDAAYMMCGYLVRLYPEQAVDMAEVVMGEGTHMNCI